MKYIFDLYWFGDGGGGQRHNLGPNDYQTMPGGGWQNWTPQHNLNFMLQMIANREQFTLLGTPDSLIGQAQNAGTKSTRCVVGAEVLLLLSAGYTPFICSQTARQGEQLILFMPPVQLQNPDQNLMNDWVSYLGVKPAAAFWTPQRKNRYRNLINQTQL